MPANRKSPVWRGDPLPRGRHGLSQRTVRASQKARIIRAMQELVARQGYRRTTVPEVVAAARVSRNAFYECFDDKEDCFLAACEQDAGEMVSAISAAASERGWREALRAGMRTYLRWWQDRPELSRAYFLEMPTVGTRAVAQRERAYRPFEEIFRQLMARARVEQPELLHPPDVVPRLLVIAITEFVAVEVRAGHGDRLVGLEEDLIFLATQLLAVEAKTSRAA
ncbi:MAG: TetR/AcrR family transcriptional regulator [Nevskiales bacterium]